MHALAPLFAHEKWFVEGDLPDITLWRATEPLPLSLILAVVIASTLAWAFFVSRDRRPLLPGPEQFNATQDGLAVFFWLCGRGPWSIDRLLFPAFEPSPRLQRHALRAARIGLGLSLIVVAFTEKLGNPALAEKFLEVHRLNFTHLLGIPLSNYVFAMCAGAVELLVGIWVTFGIFIRLIIVIAWFPFNLTLTHFNWIELIGHLPFYGLLAVLLVWDPQRH